jgi:hypothetical protein
MAQHKAKKRRAKHAFAIKHDQIARHKAGGKGGWKGVNAGHFIMVTRMSCGDKGRIAAGDNL